MEARKVQRVGYSTLTVSLPRGWVGDVKLKAGDIVSIKREDDGSLKLIPGTERKREEVKNVVVNTDLCNSPNLLTRVITGNYILGHDTIQVVAKDELKKVHLEEIRATTQRLTGLSIVEQTLKQITLQSFVDPTRFPIYGLMRRLHIIISSMLDASIKALVERRPELAAEVTHMEEESDRIYWLIVRQLLLAIRDRSAGSKMGIESPRPHTRQQSGRQDPGRDGGLRREYCKRSLGLEGSGDGQRDHIERHRQVLCSGHKDLRAQHKGIPHRRDQTRQ